MRSTNDGIPPEPHIGVMLPRENGADFCGIVGIGSLEAPESSNGRCVSELNRRLVPIVVLTVFDMILDCRHAFITPTDEKFESRVCSLALFLVLRAFDAAGV